MGLLDDALRDNRFPTKPSRPSGLGSVLERARQSPLEKTDSLVRDIESNGDSDLLNYLATASLVGVGAYAGVRYFPKFMQNRAKQSLVSAAQQQVKRTGGTVQNWFGQVADAFRGHRRSWLAKDIDIAQDPALLGKPGSRNLHLAEQIVRLKEVMAADSKFGGNFQDVINSFVTHHRQDHLFEGVSPMTFSHLFQEGGVAQSAVAHIMGGRELLSVRQGISSLAKLPKFRTELQANPHIRKLMAQQGHTDPVQAFLQNARVGEGLGVKKLGAGLGGPDSAALIPVDSYRWSAKGILNRLTQVPLIPVIGDRLKNVPFIGQLAGIKPFELLMPTQLFNEQPRLAFLDKGFMQKAFDNEAYSGGLFAGGKILPYVSADGRKTIGSPVGTGYRAGLMSSGMGLGHQARWELGRTNDPQGIGLLEKLQSKFSPNSFMEKTIGGIRKFGKSLGRFLNFGPEYSKNKSNWARMFAPFDNLANKRQYSPLDLGEGWFQDSPNRASQFIGDKLTDLAHWSGLGRSSIFQHHTIGYGAGAALTGRVPRAKGWIGTRSNPVTGYVDRNKGLDSMLWRHGTKDLGEFAGAPSMAGRARGSSAGWYAFKGTGTGLADWANYQLTRPFWLVEEMTGMSLKPGRTPLATLGRITKLGATGYALAQGAQYADYKAKQLTAPFWNAAGLQPMGPLGMVASAAAGARVGIQYGLEATGLAGLARSVENMIPGSMGSPGAAGIRALGTAFGGSALAGAMGLGTPGALAAIGLAGVMALDPTKKASELKEEYFGDRDVAVRANRFWGLGSSPFEGDRIKYWRPNWYRRFMSGAADAGRYGSEQGAWSMGASIPVPENLFGLRNLFDPYAAENANYWNRPYPATGGMGGDVPVVGPLLSATIGRLIKPTQYREGMSVSPGGKAHLQAAEFGMAGGPVYDPNTVTETRGGMNQAMASTANRLQDWMGMTGFLTSAIKAQITGDKDFATHQQTLQESSSLGSTGRRFYDLQLGGMLGTTELLRRFIVKDRKTDTINEVPNFLPDWLPGSRSRFAGDRNYYKDFHKGDPMSDLPEGDIRLPGAGYATLRGLDPDEPLSVLDRYKILTDVAPFSQAQRHYRTQAEALAAGGMMEQSQIDETFRIGRQLDVRMESRAGTPLRYGGATDDLTISEVTGDASFTVAERPGHKFRLAGVESNALISNRGALSETRAQLQSLVGQTVSMKYGGGGTYTPAIIGDINRQAISAGAGMEYATGLDLGAASSGPEAAIGGFMEGVEHSAATSFIPGSDFLKHKLFVPRTPVEQYEHNVAYGPAFDDWTTPYRSFIKPLVTRRLGIVSEETQTTRDLTEYMSNVSYVKNTRLASMASAANNPRLAASYSRKAMNTLPAVDPMGPRFQSQAMAAAPGIERPYMTAFAGASSADEQERILEAVPDYMKNIYMGMWNRRMPTTASTSPILTQYARQIQRDQSDPVNERVAQYFSQYQAPDESWVGWSPAVDEEQVLVRMIDESGGDVNAAGYYPSEVREARRETAFVPLPSPGSSPSWLSELRIRRAIEASGMDVNSMTHQLPGRQSQMSVQRKKKRRPYSEYAGSSYY